MNRKYLSWESFLEYISELERHFSKELSKLAKHSWYEHLKILTEDQLYDAITKALISCAFMPTAEKLKEFAGFDFERFPGETWLDSENAAGYLPSTEQRIREEERYLTLEQKEQRYSDFVAEAAKKFIPILEASPWRVKRRRMKNPDLTAIAEVFDPQVDRRILIDDMRKYLTSGSDVCRQIAIDWACDPKNGCELVKRNGQVVDICEVEF